MPTDQRFGADDPAGLQIDERLIVKFELILVDRAAERMAKHHSIARSMVEIFVIKTVGPGACPVRRRQGDGCPLHQLRGRAIGRQIGQIIRSENHRADAGLDNQRLPAHEERLSKASHHAGDKLFGVLPDRLSAAENGKLGATQADRERGDRLLDRKLAQAGGDALERCVAIIGSKGFADLREIDEMDVGQRNVTASFSRWPRSPRRVARPARCGSPSR